MKYLFLFLLFIPFFLRSQTDFGVAENLYKAKNYTTAKSIFEKLVHENPNHYKSLEYLGNIAAFSEHWNVALRYFEKLKYVKRNDADFQYKYGAVLSMLAQKSNSFKALSLVGDIRSSFEKAILLNPRHIESHWALIEFYLQLPGIFGGSEYKAAYYANQLFILSPVDGYLSKGHIAEYFKRYATAEKFYKKAIEAGHSKTTYQKLADLYNNKLHNPEKAKAAWNDYAKEKS